MLRLGDGGVAEMEGGAEHHWPDTLDVMGWSVDPQGFFAMPLLDPRARRVL
jgi:alkylresorcinol/alkylpyrone synthase